MAYNLTGASPTYNATGKFGSSLNGGTATRASIMPTNGIWTLSFWVKANASGSLSLATGQPGLFWFGMDAAGIAKLNYGSGAAVDIVSSVNIGNNAWRHIEIDADATGVKLFIDGALAGSSATTIAASGATYAGVMEFRQFNGGSFTWPGEIDDYAVFSTVQHSSAFTAPTAAIPDSAANLIAVWHFDSNLTDTATVASTAPSAPTIGTATAGIASATVAGTAPGSNGGAAITGYTATSTPGSITGTGASLPITVSGLTNGTAYTFTLHATNSVGNSAESAASNSVTPTASATVPGAPTIGTAAASNTQATVAFTAPGSNGGAAITGYTVISTPGSFTASGASSPLTVTGLTNGTAYTFTAHATNAIGNSAESSASNSVTPAAALYTRVDTTDTITGQAIMILVPASGATNPYNSANPTGVIMYAHGMGEDQTGLVTDGLKTACVTALLNAGYILAGTNAHGSNWGAQVAVDDYAALEKYLRANYNVKGIGIWSQSMGGHAGLLAIAQSKVKGVVGWLGTYASCNLAAVYALGTYASTIDTAFGITGTGLATYSNKTYGNDPVLLPATGFKHVPMRMYASSGDTVIPKATGSDMLQALVSGTAQSSVVIACTGNHGDTSHFVPSEYVAFFDGCFATMVPTVGSLTAIAPTLTARTVTLTLGDTSGPAASLTGLKVAFYDEASPNLHTTPRYQTASGTTNSSGVMTFSVNSTLASGGTGHIVVLGAANVHYNGPCVVA